MVYKLKFTEKYECDFYDIIKYLSQFYPGTPVRFKNELSKKNSILKRMPQMFKACPYNPMYRQVSVFGYIVFYKIIENPVKIVEIHRILHSARNIERIIGDIHD